MPKLLPALTLLLSLSFLAGGCTYEQRILEGWDDGGVDCENNSNPKVGEWYLSSTPVLLPDGSPSASEWLVGSHFRWRDPGIVENEDPQNMVGGWLSLEIEGHKADFPYITSEWLLGGCKPGSESSCAALGFPSNLNPCNATGCREGTITLPMRSNDATFVEGARFHFVTRIRDRCGAVSNERDTYHTGRYTIGSGTLEVTAEAEEVVEDPS